MPRKTSNCSFVCLNIRHFFIFAQKRLILAKAIATGLLASFFGLVLVFSTP